jgi:hypothetical protein
MNAHIVVKMDITVTPIASARLGLLVTCTARLPVTIYRDTLIKFAHCAPTFPLEMQSQIIPRPVRIPKTSRVIPGPRHLLRLGFGSDTGTASADIPIGLIFTQRFLYFTEKERNKCEANSDMQIVGHQLCLHVTPTLAETQY